MGKTTFKQIERSIWQAPGGKYQVRVVASKGSQKRVKVTVRTLDEARLMRAAAEEARKEGRSVKLAWNSIRGIDGTRVRRVFIDEMFKRYLDHGDKLESQGGDHKDPAPRNGSAETRRPTTQDGHRSVASLLVS